jgi:hypothetical protein
MTDIMICFRGSKLDQSWFSYLQMILWTDLRRWRPQMAQQQDSIEYSKPNDEWHISQEEEPCTRREHPTIGFCILCHLDKPALVTESLLTTK